MILHMTFIDSTCVTVRRIMINNQTTNDDYPSFGMIIPTVMAGKSSKNTLPIVYLLLSKNPATLRTPWETLDGVLYLCGSNLPR